MVTAALKRKRNTVVDTPSNKVRVSVTPREIVADMKFARKDRYPKTRSCQTLMIVLRTR